MLLSVPLDRMLPAHRRRLAAELLRFGVVGVAGFVVDTGVLYAALAAGAGLYGGRALSYVAAATATWALNRAWTFRHRAGGPGADGAGWQWALFLVVNLFGFAANYGTYALLVSQSALVAAHPILGVAAGALAGMGGNFLLSRRYVFREATTP